MNDLLQFVWWWPEWKGVGFYRWSGNWKTIYEWSIRLGWLEVRRWARPPIVRARQPNYDDPATPIFVEVDENDAETDRDKRR